jgi:hypothetical protein
VGTGLYLKPRALEDLDQRTIFARLLLERRREVVDSLGGALPPLKQMLLDRTLFGDVILGDFEIRVFDGYQPTEKEWKQYVTLRNSNSRHAALLGLEWKEAEVENLQTYLSKNYPQVEEENEKAG